MVLPKAFFAAAALLLVLSCRFDYGEAQPSLEIEDPPDFVLHRMDYHVRMSDGSRVTFISRTGEFRDSDKQALLVDTQFLQYDPDDEIITRGSSQEAVLDLDTEDAVLTGEVVIDALQEDVNITAQRLYWNREDQTLTSGPGDMVTMVRSNGTITQGKGFTADLYRREFGFSDEARGVIYEEK